MDRIESVQPAIVDSVRRYGTLAVNNVPFALIEGRAISAPVTARQLAMFVGVPGYYRVDGEPPYARNADLSGGGRLTLTSTPPTEEAPLSDTASPEEAPLSDTASPEEAPLEQWTKAQLQAELERRGIRYSNRATNAQLIALLRGQ